MALLITLPTALARSMKESSELAGTRMLSIMWRVYSPEPHSSLDVMKPAFSSTSARSACISSSYCSVSIVRLASRMILSAACVFSKEGSALFCVIRESSAALGASAASGAGSSAAASIFMSSAAVPSAHPLSAAAPASSIYAKSERSTYPEAVSWTPLSLGADPIAAGAADFAPPPKSSVPKPNVRHSAAAKPPAIHQDFLCEAPRSLWMRAMAFATRSSGA